MDSRVYRVLFTCPETADVLATGVHDVPRLGLAEDRESSDELIRRYAQAPLADIVFPEMRDEQGAAVIVVLLQQDSKPSALRMVNTFAKHGDSPVGIAPRGTGAAKWVRIDDLQYASPLLSSLLDEVDVARSNPRAVTSREEALNVLGISQETARDPKALRAAYKRRALEVHPDRGGSPDGMVLVNSAFALLSEQGAPRESRAHTQSSWSPPPPRPAPPSAAPRTFASVLDAQAGIESAQASANQLRDELDAVRGTRAEDELFARLRSVLQQERAAKQEVRARLGEGEQVRVLVCVAPEDMSSVEFVGMLPERAGIRDLLDYAWCDRVVGGFVDATPPRAATQLDPEEARRTHSALGDGAWLIGLRDGSALALDPQASVVVVANPDVGEYTIYVRGLGSY